MTDRYEIARDFLLQHFTPEELPEVMARVLKGAGLAAESTLMAHPDECLRVLTTAWEEWSPTSNTDAFCPNCTAPCDGHVPECELLADLRRIAGPIETPPRTSPPTE